MRLPPNIRMGRAWLSYVGATPFWLAAKSSDVQLMRLLLAHGADAAIPAVQNVTPLMAAAGLGFWDAESPAPQNGTPETDTLEAVQICVELGADVNETTSYGVIRVQGDPRELRSRYVFPEELPADGKAYGDMRWAGATALHGAALRGVNTVVKYLVEKGARLDARTTLGWTPLMVADHVFASNVERSWPETAAYIRDLMKERGLAVDEAPAEPGATSPRAPDSLADSWLPSTPAWIHDRRFGLACKSSSVGITRQSDWKERRGECRNNSFVSCSSCSQSCCPTDYWRSRAARAPSPGSSRTQPAACCRESAWRPAAPP